MNPKPHPLQLSTLALALITLVPVQQALAADAVPTEVGTVRVTGEGDALGNGLMIEDDGTKQRATVTKAAIDKQRSTTNPFQLLNLQAGVNANSQDATGLFGGNIRVRGFNSDQMGLTINGAPVNDSGSYSVFPQEYTDSENLCELFVTQGSADTEAPHVGASGGNIGLVTCGPNDAAGGKIAQSIGTLNFTKTFLRADTGKLGTQMPFKAFLSFSHAKVDKFKGSGGADRDHIDAGLDWRLAQDTSFSANVLYNRAVNNNILTLTKAEFAANPNLDYAPNAPQHVGTGSDATNFGTSSVTQNGVRSKLAYYGYSLNPFENWLFTSRLSSRINSMLTLSAEPYYWWGYGTGGTQQNTLTESTSNGTKLNFGIGDINRNGVNTDVVGIYRGSVTKTNRPGITVKADVQLENQHILAGIWYEDARHRQTAPATTVDNNGNVSNLWLDSNLITYNNGQLYENRNYFTESRAHSVFASDTLSFGKLEVVPGLRQVGIERRFENYASSGGGLGADYSTTQNYSRLLPSLGATYKLDDAYQLYGNVARNMKTPGNFEYSGWVSSVTYQNGAVFSSVITPTNRVKEETATNAEAGIRFSTDVLKGSFAVYNVTFQNRIASAYNPETNTTSDLNAGGSTIRGFEAQFGTKPVNHMSLFGSLTYTDAKLDQDTSFGPAGVAATSGKQFPDTPKWMAGLSAQYASGPYLAELTGKYTGTRQTTLVNDESLAGYTTFDLNLAYRFASNSVLQNPTLRVNVSNLFNEHYLLASLGSGSSIATSITPGTPGASGALTYYVGAPRFFSMSLGADF